MKDTKELTIEEKMAVDETAKFPMQSFCEIPIAELALEMLSNFWKRDPEGCKKLLEYRVKTNSDVAWIPQGITAGPKENPTIDVMGLINGILDPVTHHRLALCYDKGELIGFKLYNQDTLFKLGTK